MSYNAKLEDRIDHHFIGQQEITKNKQMGGAGWLINGNMCVGVYEDLLVVRVDPAFIDSLIRKDGISYFGERGEKRDRFISVSRRVYTYPKALHKFLSHSLKFTSTLPSNEKTLYDEP